jgi:chromosome segregation ATPase
VELTRLDAITRERDTLQVELTRLEAVGEEWKARAAEAQARADSAESTVPDIEGALASARSEAEAAKDRATVARVRLDEIVHERDALLGTVATLQHDAQERERQTADDLARAEAALDLAATAGLEEALVAARFDAETLRGETTALAAQLEEAWSQVEAARRAATSARAAEAAPPADPADAAVDAESTDAGDSLLDALAELAATPDLEGDGTLDEDRKRPVEREVRMAPPAPDPEDPDARRAALGFLNSLATDLSKSRAYGR